MSSIECISLNVRGLRNINKKKRLFRNLRERKLDVICLQETYITEDVIEQWKKNGEVRLFISKVHGMEKGK